MKPLKIIVVAIVAVLLLIQLIPVSRTNPKPTGPLEAPPPVKSLIARACYDCHSDETRWLWYSYVAPISWLVASDVKTGRHLLNFSEWQGHSAEEQKLIKKNIVMMVSDGSMPPSPYTWMHRAARLTKDDIDTLKRWSESD